MKMLVSEAYSASNLGDRELVLETVRVARSRNPAAQIVVMAVDPESFRPYVDGFDLSHRLFPRLAYLHARGLGKAMVLIRWAVLILVLSFLTLLPSKTMRVSAARRFPNQLVRSIASSGGMIAVGGGYLGDRYAKEVLLTSWQWWWAGRLGLVVETMPISVELSDNLLGRLFSFFSKRVEFRVRDSASSTRLLALGLESEILPDLAFLNALEIRSASSKVSDGPAAVALVGSDYLEDGELGDLVQRVADGLEAVGTPTVVLVSMHSNIGGTSVGGDVEASRLLLAELTGRGIAASLRDFKSYLELCDFLAGCPFLLSARMHAGIAGLCSGTRVGLLAYEEKHFALMDDMDLSDQVVDIRSPKAQVVGLIRSLADKSARTGKLAADERAKKLVSSLGMNSASRG